MYEYFNPNPVQTGAGDCAFRAIAKALGLSWEEADARLTVNGFLMGDMPSSDLVWGSVLRQAGFSRETIPNTCPDCYTAEDFTNDHPQGTFILKSTGHVATVVDSVLFDSWDSSRTVPIYFWYKPEEKG